MLPRPIHIFLRGKNKNLKAPLRVANISTTRDYVGVGFKSVARSIRGDVT